jgi:hypothetical protein
MKTSAPFSSFAIGFILLGVLCGTSSAQSAPHPDDLLYDEMFTARGKVEILNHPDLGRTAGSNVRLLFQRVGCKLCLYAVTADSDGDYMLTVGRGKYRVISRDTRGGGHRSSDMLAKSMNRIIDLTSGNRVKTFNIFLELKESQ